MKSSKNATNYRTGSFCLPYRLGAGCASGNAIRYIRAVRECELRDLRRVVRFDPRVTKRKKKNTPGGCFVGVDAIAREICG